MQYVLLDIEGTTSSVRFVYDVMFPYARQHVGVYLEKYWETTAAQHALTQMAHDAGHASLTDWFDTTHDEPRLMVLDHFIALMDQDIKATGLKLLQGLIWESAFKSGEIQAHVYDDVQPAMVNWHKQGIKIYIYSSGSIPTQKLFFSHTEAGDLLPMLSGHFDTTIGSKRHAESYHQIISEIDLPTEQILFISDVVAELDAAKDSGMQTLLSVRPENSAVDDAKGHRMIHGFDQV